MCMFGPVCLCVCNACGWRGRLKDYGCVSSAKRENTTSSLRVHVRERSMHGLCVYIPLCASLWACVCTQLLVVFWTRVTTSCLNDVRQPIINARPVRTHTQEPVCCVQWPEEYGLVWVLYIFDYCWPKRVLIPQQNFPHRGYACFCGRIRSTSGNKRVSSANMMDFSEKMYCGTSVVDFRRIPMHHKEVRAKGTKGGRTVFVSVTNVVATTTNQTCWVDTFFNDPAHSKMCFSYVYVP